MDTHLKNIGRCTPISRSKRSILGYLPRMLRHLSDGILINACPKRNKGIKIICDLARYFIL